MRNALRCCRNNSESLFYWNINKIILRRCATSFVYLCASDLKMFGCLSVVIVYGSYHIRRDVKSIHTVTPSQFPAHGPWIQHSPAWCAIKMTSQIKWHTELYSIYPAEMYHIKSEIETSMWCMWPLWFKINYWITKPSFRYVTAMMRWVSGNSTYHDWMVYISKYNSDIEFWRVRLLTRDGKTAMT